MPVVFLRKSEISSNKPEGEAGWDRVSYRYVGKNGTVSVLVPKIDKITLTSLSLKDPVCEEFDGLIPDQVKLHAEDPCNLTAITKSEAFKKGIRGYKHQYWINLPGISEKVLFQARPTDKKKTRYFRYEFNPSRLGPTGLKTLKKRLQMFGPEGNYGHLVKNAVVTRLDVAIDLVRASMEQLVVVSAAGGKRHAYFAGQGPVQTMYLGIKPGKKSSDHYAYDRSQKEIDGGELAATKWPPVTRLEFRVTPKKLPYGDMQSIANPLERMRVFDPTSVDAKIDPTMWRLFIDSCVLRGPAGALKLLPEKLKESCEGALKKAEAIWRPEKLWDHWKMEVDESGLLEPGSTPKPKKLKHYGPDIS
jgi:hypothetical protein